MIHHNDVNLIPMQQLVMELEKKYALPNDTFILTDKGELEVYFHLELWGYMNSEISYTYMRSAYTADKVSSTLIVTTQHWDRTMIENHILATVYWEHFAHLLGLQYVSFTFDSRSFEELAFSSLSSTLTRLGYVLNDTYTKPVHLPSLDVLMTSKSDLTQVLIDRFFSDFKVSYTVSGFNHNLHCRFYDSGRSYSISFLFISGRFQVYCRELDLDDHTIDGSIQKFMSSLFYSIERKNRLKNLFMPPKYHYDQLTRYSLTNENAKIIYHFLSEHYSTEDIEMQCAHKLPEDVFLLQVGSIRVKLFDKTYCFDLNTKKVSTLNITET